MAFIEKNKLDNFISVALGLKFCVSGLQDFILDTMETIHQNILQQIPVGSKCTINCSRQHGNDFSQWCNICRAWKAELHKLCRCENQWKKIKWKEIDTIDFPHSTPDSYEAISKMFVRDARQFRQGIFQDLGAIISLFMNMTIFAIDDLVVKDIQRYRNHSFAHNYRISVDETEKKLCLQSFIRILKVQNIYRKESAKTAVELLGELLSTEGIPARLLHHQAARETLILVRESIDQLSPSADSQIVAFVSARDTFQNRINNMILESTIKQTRVTKNLISPKTRTVLKYLSLPLLLLYITISFISLQKMDPSNEGCYSMRFSEHWKSDLDFDFYVQTLNNQSFIERRWLHDIVNTHLLETNGILLTADMGYGKSSVISNLVCADSSSVWYDIRKQVLAYHFCRYDMDMSVSAGTFIRNLASAIVKHYPEMGNAILADFVASEFLYGTRCFNDPISCFEMSILNPLRGHWTNQKFIIIIDALDECDTTGRNTLFNFLLTQTPRFPSNFKFILTSRNVKNIDRYSHFLDMNVMNVYLNTSDSRNLNDVKQYVRETSKLTEPQISTLTKAANGNFLHVKLYLQYCKKTDTFDFRNVPNSLALFYQLNFNRIFKDSENLYFDFLPVFEVLCTVQNPIDKDQLIEVSKIDGNSKKRKLEMLLGNELGHFLKFENGKMSFLHKSIIDFLTDEKRNKMQFFVHKENGHKLFAEYLLGKLKMNVTSKHNLIELIHHVAMSRNPKFKSMLLGYVRDLLSKDHMLHTKLLYEVVWKYNDYHTTELLLECIGDSAVNSVNSMNQSPAFIAASQGNEKTLKCLLHNGANHSFSVVHNYSSIIDSSYNNQTTHIHTSISASHDIVQMCKYVYFCGYNVFHVAVQNGHQYVVEMILRQYRSLIHTETDMHLNAFHLAVENGHFGIVKLLLNDNKGFSDTYSLYKASEKGYEQILKLLLGTGSKDECLPCTGKFYWLPLLSNRQQQTIKYNKIRSELTYHQDVYIKTFFYDDWRLITCDTAFNAAVRNGHLEIVKILLLETFSAINCTTYDGKTSLMTAVRYNRTEIFNLLYLSGADLKTKCHHVYDNFNILSLHSKLNLLELELLTSEQCPIGATVAHVIAMHGNYDMMVFMYNNGFVDWEQRDADLATPLHYAFCHYNYIFINLNNLERLNLNFSAETVNGSSVFHSAAICRSLTLHAYHNRKDTHHDISIPDSLDYRRRSILHYSMLLPLRENNNDLHYGVKEDVLVQTIFHACRNSKHNIHHMDNEGKNFLHYAAKSGNFFGFDIALNTLPEQDAMSLLTQRDTSEKTPVDEMFQAMQARTSSDPIRIPKGCQITDVFYTKCPTKFETILTNHEMCILKTMSYLYKTGMISKVNVSELLSIAILKSRIYPVLMLKIYAEQQFQHIVQNNPPLLLFITEYEGPSLAKFFLTKNNSLKCNGNFSPLHEIIMNDRNTQSMYHSNQFLKNYLEDYSSTMLDTCFDKDGYNLLHRAAMGGNVLGTQFLLNKGMNVSQLCGHGQSALDILIIKAPFSENDIIPSRFSNISPYQVLEFVSENRTKELNIACKNIQNYDETSEILLEHLYSSRGLRRKEIATVLCRPYESRLSQVHLATAKGFISFLKKSVLLFGSDILNCYDFNNITPYYLAKIYKQESVMKWMDSIRVPRTKPNLEIESLLIYNMFFNYQRQHLFDWTCRLQYSYKHHALMKTQFSKCTRAIGERDSFILYKNAFRDIYIFWAYSVLNLLRNVQNESNMRFCDFEAQMHTCYALVDRNNLLVRESKFLKKKIYKLLRKYVKFDFHDFMFLYQKTLRHIFNEPEQKYIKVLSFNSIFCLRFRYLEQLRQKHSIHIQWLRHFLEYLEEKNEISSSVSHMYEQHIVSGLKVDMKLPLNGRQKGEKKKKYKSKLEKHETNHHGENIKYAIERYNDIFSIEDIYVLENYCMFELKLSGVEQMSTAEMLEDRINFIIYLEKEARKNAAFKERVRNFQKNMSVVLYFMQFVPTDRKSSLCMRIFIAQAKYAEKMNL
ncbi:Hypothetical predicted protein [Mytilus galloprovincialis]|uniref:Nephrocystin 3-like N-terminal domain-containing protein n=1 Tax=Mytilus galloprovincialis TaxID=29158 RepID=A0A8B6CXL1_MYTGA|nr:Hypothetical predicted protein [Mytilus galloprovincialis]